MKIKWDFTRGIAQCFWHTVRVDINAHAPIRDDGQCRTTYVVAMYVWDRDGHTIMKSESIADFDTDAAKAVAQKQLDILVSCGIVGCNDPEATGQTVSRYRAPRLS